MYNIEELNMQLLSDLKGIAEQLGVKNYKKLAKQELIYAILDTQASTPEKDLPVKKKAETKSERPKRVNVKKEKAEKPIGKKKVADFEKSADELLESFDLELDLGVSRCGGSWKTGLGSFPVRAVSQMAN